VFLSLQSDGSDGSEDEDPISGSDDDDEDDEGDKSEEDDETIERRAKIKQFTNEIKALEAAIEKKRAGFVGGNPIMMVSAHPLNLEYLAYTSTRKSIFDTWLGTSINLYALQYADNCDI